MSSVEKLVFLVNMKNDLNRKRRRFYYYKRRDPIYKDRKPSHISSQEGEDGYQLAKREMKAMTAEIRALRMELGARFVWDDNGRVAAIRFKANSKIDMKGIYARDFKRWVDAYLVEGILLGGGKDVRTDDR